MLFFPRRCIYTYFLGTVVDSSCVSNDSGDILELIDWLYSSCATNIYLGLGLSTIVGDDEHFVTGILVTSYFLSAHTSVVLSEVA